MGVAVWRRPQSFGPGLGKRILFLAPPCVMVETRRSKRESTSTAVSSVQSPKRAKAEQPGRVKAKANTVSLEAAGDDTENRPFFWLFKSEPETRMEKGVDVGCVRMKCLCLCSIGRKCLALWFFNEGRFWPDVYKLTLWRCSGDCGLSI